MATGENFSVLKRNKISCDVYVIELYTLYIMRRLRFGLSDSDNNNNKIMLIVLYNFYDNNNPSKLK